MHVELKRITLTPSEAGQWNEEYRFPQERPLRQWWVNELADRLLRDQWEPGLAKIHEVDGQPFRIDSQHRCHAIVQAGVPAAMNLEWTWGSTWEIARAAYNRTDRIIPRGQGDWLRTSGLCESEGVTVTQARAVLAGLRFMKADWKDARYHAQQSNPDDDARALLHWLDAARGYFQCLERKKRKITNPLHDSGAVAVWLTLFSRPPDEQDAARRFLTRLVSDSGLVEGEPEHTLLDFIREPLIEKSKQAFYRRSQTYLCRAIAAAWNAWVDGRPLKRIQVVETNPMILKHAARPLSKAA